MALAFSEPQKLATHMREIVPDLVPSEPRAEDLVMWWKQSPN